MTEQQPLAIAAAAQASEATTELLRYAREGAHSDCFAFADEVMTKLADALKLAIAIERPHLPIAAGKFGQDEEAMGALTDLHAALERFLEHWSA